MVSGQGDKAVLIIIHDCHTMMDKQLSLDGILQFLCTSTQRQVISDMNLRYLEVYCLLYIPEIQGSSELLFLFLVNKCILYFIFGEWLILLRFILLQEGSKYFWLPAFSHLLLLLLLGSILVSISISILQLGRYKATNTSF